MLVRHLRKYHRDNYDEVMELELQKKQKLGGMEPSEKENQPKMTKYIMYFPTFETAFINWMIQMYQPMSMCENASFRTLCQRLSPKAPLLGCEKASLILMKQMAWLH